MRHVCLLAVALLGSALFAAEANTPLTDWEKEIDRKLERRVTFQFADTPLVDALAFQNQLTRINMVVDPAVTRDGVPAITLNVANVTIREALAQVLEMAGLESVPADQALFIVKKGSYKQTETPVQPLTAEQIAVLKKAIPSLGDQEFSQRDAATKTLAALGRGAQPHLEEALKTTQDSEVKLRLQNLISACRTRSFTPEAPEVTRALEALNRKVTLEFVDTPLRDAGNFLNTLAPAHLTVDDAVAGNSVSLRVSDMEVACALRWIVRCAGAKLALEKDALKITRADGVAKKE